MTFMRNMTLLLMFLGLFACNSVPDVPSYLADHAEAYRDNPRQANLQWFQEAKYGMFIHYGLYSQLEKGEWVQLRDTIPVAEYAKLKKTFTAEHFDAEMITDLAIRAGMKYITITSKHHDGFCLFETKATDFNVMNSPCGRDLIGELYAACEKKGLGLFSIIPMVLTGNTPTFIPGKPAGTMPGPHIKNLSRNTSMKRRRIFKSMWSLFIPRSQSFSPSTPILQESGSIPLWVITVVPTSSPSTPLMPWSDRFPLMP